MKDDSLVICIDDEPNTIAFPKDKGIEWIIINNLNKSKWRALGTFLHYEFEYFEDAIAMFQVHGCVGVDG